MTRLALLRGISTWALSAWAVSALALSAPAHVGWVADFDGLPEHYTLVRGNGQLVPVGVFTPLYADDRVSVNHDTHTIRLALDGGRVIETIGRRDHVYVVRQGTTLPGTTANLMAWAASWFTSWKTGQPTRTVVAVHARGEVALPLLAGGQARLAAGSRPLYLAWLDGTPPYEVRVRRDRTPGDLAVLTQLPDRRARMDGVVLAPGRYTVEIRWGQEPAGVLLDSFGVVPPEAVPAEPDALGRTDLPEPVRRTLFAAWLASQGRGQWTLEAYQTAAALAKGFPPAALLRDNLEQGGRPMGTPE